MLKTTSYNDNRGDIIQLDVHKKALYHKPSYSPLWASRCHMELPSNFLCGRSSINPNTWIILAKYLDSCFVDGVTKFQNEVAKHWINVCWISMLFLNNVHSKGQSGSFALRKVIVNVVIHGDLKQRGKYQNF